MDTERLLENARRYASVGSTNDIAKALAEGGAPEGTVVLADRQESGRGQHGHSFYSPAGGLYMSLVLRPALPAADALGITTAAAVAAAKAIEALTGKKTGIKWVNDVFWGGKKVCGILCEGAFAPDGHLRYAVLGIGVDLTAPEGGFPEDLQGIAGALFPYGTAVDREGFAQSLLSAFFGFYENLAEKPHLADYRARDLLSGNRVCVLHGGNVREADALGIGSDFSLRVRYADGREEDLTAGEVSVKR